MSPAPTVLRFACPATVTDIALPLPDGSIHRPDLSPGTGDQEYVRDLNGGTVRVILRRVHCTIADGLLRTEHPDWHLSPQTRAALLWRAFRRYDQLVGLKVLSGGLSGSDVLVFRPRLRAPMPNAFTDIEPAALATAGPLGVVNKAWGTPLLVKTGPEDAIAQEWARSEVFLRDRRSPFLARNEELLRVRPVGPTEPAKKATMISSFLGGDVVRAEPLDKLIRGTRDPGVALRALDAVVDHLATWHTNTEERTLAEWPRAFWFEADPDDANRVPGAPPAGWPGNKPAAPWLLFSQYNFRKETQKAAAAWDMPRPRNGAPSLGRGEFRAGVTWDYPFVDIDHLEGHLLGPVSKRNGLLYALAEMPALFSLVHGDLNPRNVLCDADKVWLIDFEKTGVGPVLADLARLEVNLRLWCIELGPATDGATDAARRLEYLLLDHLHGGESSLEPVRRFAPALGADPDELEKVARCVVHLRALARRWCVPDFADSRDYLAALYLNVLGLLPYAGRGHTGPTNERWLMGLFWALEETLDRVLGRVPFDREQRPYDPLHHVSADLVHGPGLARRVNDLCNTADGRLALAPLSALRGVLQGGYHHLDAYHHTLAVVAYLEAILADPVDALLDPAALDAAVTARLAAAGIALTPPDEGQTNPPPPDVPWLDTRQAAVKSSVAAALTDEAKCALMWCTVLHDVGKPGTRTVKEKADGLEVQFLGHQGYGVALLRERLLAWFPDPEAKPGAAEPNALGGTVRALILDHHVSHQFIRYLFDPRKGVRPVDDLYAALARPHGAEVIGWLAVRTDPAENPLLPLLLLHGYADRLAARGRHWGITVTQWAEATLALLAFLADRSALVDTSADIRRRPADAQQARKAAAERHAADLLGTDRPRDPTFGRVAEICKHELIGREGTDDELLAHLRRVIDRDELNRRLGRG